MSFSIPQFVYSYQQSSITKKENTTSKSNSNTFANITHGTEVTTTKIMSVEGHKWGVITNKGVYLAIYNGKECVIFGKDGVCRLVEKASKANSWKGKIGNSFGARALGVVDTIQIAVAGPVFVALHTTVFLACTAGTVCLTPCLLGSKENKQKLIICAAMAIANLGSVLSMSAATGLTPIETVVPEFNIRVLKMQKWSKSLPESQGEKITGTFTTWKTY